MALSYVTYSASGSDTDFTITFDYLLEAYVKVYLDGVLKTVTTDYTFFNATTIRFNTAPSASVLVRVQRNTLDTARLVDFQDAGNLTEADLDQSADQLFHLQQEVLDSVNDNSLQLDTDNQWDAESHPIKNLSDPTNAQDAVTKTWAETAMTSELALAIIARTAAETAETNAETAETAAAASESAAASSETAAGTSESNAASSASAAASSETAAASSESAAASSETAAGTSETNAAASESAAATSETNAATSETNAAASYDSFDDRYLGAKASAPTLDNDGNTLIVGAMYWNTATTLMYAWGGTVWHDLSQAIANLATFTATASQTTFTGGGLSYTAGSLLVFHNGVKLDPSDYTATDGTSVVLDTGATVGDIINTVGWNTFDVANTYTKAELDAGQLDSQYYTEAEVDSRTAEWRRADIGAYYRWAADFGGTIQYATLADLAKTLSTTEETASFTTKMLHAGTFQSAVIRCTNNSFDVPLTFTVRKNGVDTALSVVVAIGSTAEYSFTGSFSFVAGDIITIRLDVPAASTKRNINDVFVVFAIGRV